MKRKIKWLILPALVLFSSCQIFLGPEPDTGPSEILKSLWNDFNNIHANLDFRMSNNLRYNSWHDVYHNKQTGYALKIYPNMSEESLFNVCANMLNELNDPHVGLYAPGKFFSSYTVSDEDFSVSTARSYLNGGGNGKYKNFIFGTFVADSDIGYVYIKEFVNETPKIEDQEWGKVIDDIISALANTKALVLDVRGNRGGNIYSMEYIAARFVSESKDYLKIRVKTGPGSNDLSAPIIYTIKSVKKASDGQYGYTKPIVLITNKNTASVAEWLTMALRTQSHVTQIGTATCGAFSPRNERFMINGWIYSISQERVTDMNGIYYEGIGISPDKEHIIENTTSQDDKQLEEALIIAEGAE